MFTIFILIINHSKDNSPRTTVIIQKNMSIF
ncbi:MAG: hypothetical protein ACI86M_003723, partial [Saprospiraceae bacterium]